MASAPGESQNQIIIPNESSNDLRIVKTEKFDINALASLLNHDGIDRETKNVLKAYKRMRQNGNVVQVVYEFGKELKQLQIGRMYPQKGIGLQNFPSDVRSALASTYGWDIDMVNSQPVILMQLCEQSGWTCTKLKEYVTNRASKLHEVMEYLGCDRDGAKEVCLATMFGAKYKKVPDFIKLLAAELGQIAINVVAKYPHILKVCSKKPEPTRSCVAHVIQDYEFRILQHIDNVLQTKGRYMSTYIHDGGIVDKLDGELAFPDELLRYAEEEVQKKFEISITLAVKPMSHSFVFRHDLMRALYLTEAEYQQRKEAFEVDHFWCSETDTICHIVEGGIAHIKKASASVTCASYNFQCTKDRIINVTDFSSIWLRDPTKRTVSKLAFYPDVSYERPDEYNLYTGLVSARPIESLEHRDAILERYNILIDQNSGKNPEMREYMLKWLALNVQKPWVIPGVAIVLINTNQGVGKDTLGNFHGRKVIGDQYFKNIINVETQLFDAHSTAFDRTLFMKLEEVNGTLTRKFSDQLKGFITSTTCEINPKGIAKYTLDAFPHIMMTTNNAVPVKVEGSDRRFCISYTSSDYMGNSKFWDETYRLLDLPEAGSIVYDYLMRVDLSGFDVKAFPKTDYHQTLSESEAPSEVAFIEQLEPFSNKRATPLYDEYVVYCNSNRLQPKSIVHFARSLAPLIETGVVSKKNHSNVSVYSKK